MSKIQILLALIKADLARVLGARNGAGVKPRNQAQGNQQNLKISLRFGKRFVIMTSKPSSPENLFII